MNGEGILMKSTPLNNETIFQIDASRPRSGYVYWLGESDLVRNFSLMIQKFLMFSNILANQIATAVD